MTDFQFTMIMAHLYLLLGYAALPSAPLVALLMLVFAVVWFWFSLRAP